MIINVHAFAGWWEPGMGVHYTWANTDFWFNEYREQYQNNIYTAEFYNNNPITSHFFKKNERCRITYSDLSKSCCVRSWNTFLVLWSILLVTWFVALLHEECEECHLSCIRIWTFLASSRRSAQCEKQRIFNFFARCFRRCALTNWKPGRD